MKVSVIVMTYNHEGFIEQALDSVLLQRTAFDYEILVSEDCSTDGTREIVLGYQRRFPEKFRLLLSEKNICSNAVVARCIRAARGEYVALLDGDDYWTASDKLQKQADFLDRHPECSMCFHNAQVIYENDDRPPRNWTPADQPEFSDLEDIWMGNFIATCSTMFRRAPLGELPDWYDDLVPMITDWPLHILNAERGKIGYIDEVMGAYRYHTGGLFSPYSETDKQNKILEFLRKMNQCLQYKYDDLARTSISKYFFEWAEEYKNRGNYSRARECFKVFLSGKPFNKYISWRRALKLGLKIHLLGLLRNDKGQATGSGMNGV